MLSFLQAPPYKLTLHRVDGDLGDEETEEEKKGKQCSYMSSGTVTTVEMKERSLDELDGSRRESCLPRANTVPRTPGQRNLAWMRQPSVQRHCSRSRRRHELRLRSNLLPQTPAFSQTQI